MGIGDITFEKELSYSFSNFKARNFATIVTSVTVTTTKIWAKK